MLMIPEIWKRPFVRPLMVWIAGILLQSLLDVQHFSLLLLLFPLGLLLISYRKRINRDVALYSSRWLWGASFGVILLLTSIQWTAYRQQNPGNSRAVSLLQIKAYEYREGILSRWDRLDLDDREKSVLSTITLGYRTTMDRETRRKFSTIGVAHVLAVSGFHVGIAGGFISFLLAGIPRGRSGTALRYILTILLLWGYVFQTGLSPSSIRAGLMLSLFLTGRFLSKTTDRYNTLAAAAFCMLMYYPLWLFDIGFQLSFIAVFFIFCLQPLLRPVIEVKNPVLAIPWGWVTVTLAAQTGVTLLCIYYFGQFSWIFLLSNIPVTALATLLIPVAFVWILLPATFPGYMLIQNLTESLTRMLVNTVDYFNRLPGHLTGLTMDAGNLVLGFLVLLCCILYCYLKRPLLLLSGLFFIWLVLLRILSSRYFV